MQSFFGETVHVYTVRAFLPETFTKFSSLCSAPPGFGINLCQGAIAYVLHLIFEKEFVPLLPDDQSVAGSIVQNNMVSEVLRPESFAVLLRCAIDRAQIILDSAFKDRDVEADITNPQPMPDARPMLTRLMSVPIPRPGIGFQTPFQQTYRRVDRSISLLGADNWFLG